MHMSMKMVDPTRDRTASSAGRTCGRICAAAGLVIKEEDYMLNVPRSQRGGEIIEPMISTQWFVRMETLAEPALEAVRSGRIQHCA